MGPWSNSSVHISTERLEILAPNVDTWRALFEGDVEAASEGYPTEGDLVMARLVVEGHLPAGEWGPWQIRERASGMLIGGVGFKGAPDDDGVAEIGYGLAPAGRGRGLATEAVLALVAHAFARGVRAVRAEVATGHTASERVVMRAGFTAGDSDADVTWWWRAPR